MSLWTRFWNYEQSQVWWWSLTHSGRVCHGCCIEHKATVKIRDLDKLTTVEEVTAAINTTIEGSVEANVFVSRANSSGQKVATITLTMEKAETSLAKGHLKIAGSAVEYDISSKCLCITNVGIRPRGGELHWSRLQQTLLQMQKRGSPGYFL